MQIFFQFNDRYGKKILPLQDSIYRYGNRYLDRYFPGLDKVQQAIIIK